VIVMATAAILGLLALSSAALAILARWIRPNRGLVHFRSAVGEAMSFTGLWTVCLAANLLLGVAIVLGVRTLTARFLSVYLLNDITLVVCSAVQAAIVQALLRPGLVGGAGPHAR
jgi:hypothetical protein